MPAPARTHSGPLRVLATSRCSASRPPRIRSSSEAALSKFCVVTLLLFRLDYRVLESALDAAVEPWRGALLNAATTYRPTIEGLALHLRSTLRAAGLRGRIAVANERASAEVEL